MVGMWYYIQLLIMKDPSYGRMCFKSVITPRSCTFLAVKKGSPFGLDLFHVWSQNKQTNLKLWVAVA